MVETQQIIKGFISTFETVTRNPDVHGSGRTTKMCREVVDAVMKLPRDKNQVVVIWVVTRRIGGSVVKPILLKLLDDNAVLYQQERTTVTIPPGITIRFDVPGSENNYAGCHPDPLCFMDHYTEEVVVLEGLQAIVDRLKRLKEGVR